MNTKNTLLKSVFVLKNILNFKKSEDIAMQSDSHEVVFQRIVEEIKSWNVEDFQAANVLGLGYQFGFIIAMSEMTTPQQVFVVKIVESMMRSGYSRQWLLSGKGNKKAHEGRFLNLQQRIKEMSE